MFRLHPRYLVATSGLLLLEMFIALRVHDAFVRPYAGDFLATIFVYCLVRSFVVARPGPAVLGALLFSYLIEGLQYCHLLTLLGWQQWRLARVVLGSHFEWADVLAYTLGAAAVLLIEGTKKRGRESSWLSCQATFLLNKVVKTGIFYFSQKN